VRVDAFSKMRAMDRPASLWRSVPELHGQIDQREELRLGQVDLFEQAPPVQSGQGRGVGDGGHAGSRSMGQVMQRGPPRPRPSSLPATVTTSIPCLASMVLVATLRS
jgi:hypothetical protein